MGKVLFPHNNSDFSLGKNEVELCIVTFKNQPRCIHFFHNIGQHIVPAGDYKRKWPRITKFLS